VVHKTTEGLLAALLALLTGVKLATVCVTAFAASVASTSAFSNAKSASSAFFAFKALWPKDSIVTEPGDARIISKVCTGDVFLPVPGVLGGQLVSDVFGAYAYAVDSNNACFSSGLLSGEIRAERLHGVKTVLPHSSSVLCPGEARTGVTVTNDPEGGTIFMLEAEVVTPLTEGTVCRVVPPFAVAIFASNF
jgi:hypothetical protein